MARKPKGAQVWQPSHSLLDSFKFTAGNPVLFQDPNTGHISLLFVLINRNYWNDAEMYISSSEDDGHTWRPSEKIGHTRGIMIRHHPVFCADSTPLLPAHDEEGKRSVLLRKSSRHWEQVYKFDHPVPELIQPSLIRDSNNRLALFFRPTEDPRRIWRSHSIDEGNTWTIPMRTPLPCPLSGISAFSIGNLIGMVYNHTDEYCHYPLSISFSENGGVTWSEPRHIDQVEKEVSYPVFLAGTVGLIHGIYTYMRRMVKYVAFHSEEVFPIQ